MTPPLEEAVVFDCQGERLVGVIAHPASSSTGDKRPKEVGVVVIVGGPQYRVGSHRQFLHLARALAAEGYPVMRFDVRGMGDSTGDLHTFEHITPDIGRAIDTLQHCAPQVRHVVLWGLCDGASAALLYCQDTSDARVKGLCLLNPWVRSEASLAKTHVKHYYTQRLRQREFWVKLFSGQVAWGALAGLGRNIKMALSRPSAGPSAAQLPYQDRMAVAWDDFEGDMLLLLSGDDYTAKEFLEHTGSSPAWSLALVKERLIQRIEPEADHTFSQRRFDAVVPNHALDLLGRLPPAQEAR